MTRREIFQSTSSALAFSALSYSRVSGANSRLAIGLIGCGARGTQLQTAFQKRNGVPVAALCDVWATRSEQAMHHAPDARLFSKHEELLEMSGLDAVIVATPDHWHAPIAIEALKAGKDVYVEKPLTLKMEEGAAIIEAARLNSRVCQVGAQQRSGSHYLQAKEEYIGSGKLGKINLVKTWWFDGGGQSLSTPTGSVLGHRTPPGMEQKPADLNWNRYLGSVRWRSWHPSQYFNFRNYIDFSGGILTDKFVHWVDAVHMMMGQDNPIAAETTGGIFLANDDRTVPDTLQTSLEYPGKWLCTYFNTPQAGLQREGIEFCGSDAHLRIDRTKFEVFLPGKTTPLVVPCRGDLVEDHVQNFLDCCVSRKTPNGDVLAGHRSAQAAHLANISYYEKRRIHFDPEREAILPA